jgi:hypothetical protein
MDIPLLKTRARHALLASGLLLAAGCLFDDPLEELDPNAVFVALEPGDSLPVARGHILESFGAYACASCPDAEGRLRPYIHPELNSPRYRSDLVVVNYHVAFPGTLTDPWITPGTQARNDQLGFTSLPQVKMNGSNAPYGIREKGVLYAQGEYDSLVSRIGQVDSLTYLALRVDTAHYDSGSRRMTIRFTVSNRDSAAREGLSFRVLAVKNLSVVIPILPNHPWEVIVAEITDRDAAGNSLVASRIPGRHARSWVTAVSLGPESEKSPPPPNPENPGDYGIVALVLDASGVVLNVATYHFNPQP